MDGKANNVKLYILNYANTVSRTLIRRGSVAKRKN